MTNQEIISRFVATQQLLGKTCEYFTCHKDFYSFRWELIFLLDGKRVTVLGEKFKKADGSRILMIA